jgi:hypothetical protein
MINRDDGGGGENVTLLRLVSFRLRSDVMSDTLVDYHVAPNPVIDASVQSYQQVGAMDSLHFGLIAMSIEPFACEVVKVDVDGCGARQVSPGNLESS